MRYSHQEDVLLKYNIRMTYTKEKYYPSKEGALYKY